MIINYDCSFIYVNLARYYRFVRASFKNMVRFLNYFELDLLLLFCRSSLVDGELPLALGEPPLGEGELFLLPMNGLRLSDFGWEPIELLVSLVNIL